MTHHLQPVPAPDIDWMKAAMNYSPFGWNTIYYACECGGLSEHLVQVGGTYWIGCVFCGTGERERISPSNGEPGDGIWFRSERGQTVIDEILNQKG